MPDGFAIPLYFYDDFMKASDLYDDIDGMLGDDDFQHAGVVVEVLEGLDGQLRVRHERRIINAQAAPPSPAFLRNDKGDTATPLLSPAGAYYSDQRWAATLKVLDSRAGDEEHQVGFTGGTHANSTPATTSPRKPTYLQKERLKAIQKARRKGMSLRAIKRELGIHRTTTRKYMDVDGPPGRRSRTALSSSSSDTVAAWHSDIYAEHIAGHLSSPSTPQWYIISPPLTQG